MLLPYLLAVLPGLILCFLIIRFDKRNSLSVFPSLLSFITGTLLVLPAIYLASQGDFFFGGQGIPNWVTSFILVASVEEGLKFLFLLLLPYVYFFKRPIDGIRYSILVGMGFAIAENLYFDLGSAWRVLLYRTCTTLVAHASFSIILGAYMGRAKFSAGQSNFLLLRGLLVTICLHGFYNFFLISKTYTWMAFFSILTLVISFLIALYMFNRVEIDSRPTSI